MPSRLSSLTDEQRAAIPGHVGRWTQIAWCTEEADWDGFAAAAARCYRFAGLAWHGRVVRVPNPLVMALAGPIAAYVSQEERGAVAGSVRDAVDHAVRDAVLEAVSGAVADEVFGATELSDDDGAPVPPQVITAKDGVATAVSGTVEAARDGVTEAVKDAAYRDRRGDAIEAAVVDAVCDALDGTRRGRIRDAARDAYHGYYRLGLWDSHLDGQWQVSGAPGRLGSAWWEDFGSSPVGTSYLRDICHLSLGGDLWDRDRAYADAQAAAGWWWPHRQYVMVTDRPRELHLERVGPTGSGSHRPHCATGPAIRWADGWALYFLHGERVPADRVERG